MKIEDIYRQIPKSTCPPECGECCGMLSPSSAEIRNIKNWCGIRHIEYWEFSTAKEIKCPYLDEKKDCLIYPVRPFLCRITGVSEDVPCPVKKCQPVRMLNKPQSNALYREIYLRGKERKRTARNRRLVEKVLNKR